MHDEPEGFHMLLPHVAVDLTTHELPLPRALPCSLEWHLPFLSWHWYELVSPEDSPQ